MPKVFVYGAQMAHPDSVGAAWPGRVRDHAVRFVAPGLPLFEPAFAAIEAAPGALAHGVIVDFDDATWASLIALERSYEPRELEVELLTPEDAAELGASTLRCPAFFLARPGLSRERQPSARYARKLAAGARAHGLPPEVVTRYEHAAAHGSRLTLTLAWLFPLASRIGLIPTAIVVLGVIPLALIALWMWLI